MALSTQLTLWRLPARYRFMVPITMALSSVLGSLIVIIIWTGMGGDAVSDALLSIGDLYNNNRYD